MPYRVYLDARQRRIYDAWQRQHTEQPPALASLTEQPLISIIVPTYNTPVPFLREMVQSVVAQSYPHWELILVDDASTNETTRQAICDLAEDIPQLKPFFLDKNRHIAGATNYGIAQAMGEYIALLDHDDTLHPDALLWVAAAIDRTGAQFVYTDEMKQSESEITAHIQESLLNQTVIRTFEHQASSIDHLAMRQGQYLGAVKRQTFVSVFANLIMQGAFSCGYLVAFLWSARGLYGGTISFGLMTSFLQLVARIQSPLTTLISLLPTLISAKSSLDRLAHLLEFKTEQSGRSVQLTSPIRLAV